MTEIILIRHGETAFNVSNIFRGRLDVPLNDTGQKQAEMLAEYLTDWQIEAVYTSPLKRAMQTAEPVASNHKRSVIVSEGFNDFNFGEWQGLSREQAKEKCPEIYAEWATKPHLVQIPGAERLSDVRARTWRALEDILKKSYDSFVIVTHRVITKVLICALLGLDESHFWNIEHDTCGVTVFKYDDKKRFILTRHNDTSFLTRPKTPKVDFS